MNERQLGGRYLDKYKRAHPMAFVHRIADSPVSRKPFDAIVIVDGKTICIEFKMAGRPLEPHQRKELLLAKENGAVAKVIYFGKGGEVEEVTL